MAASTQLQKCCVFIDNSNLFIEGQKFFARHQRLQSVVAQDIRFRVDMGRMVNALVGDRMKIYAKLYGSEPPANDSLWKEIRNKGILVDTFQRNAEDYEKELDTSLTADVTEQSCEMRESPGSVTFIIIGGDRDYLPSYEKVLKRNWKLEIVAWKNCLSQKVKSYEEKNRNKGVSLILLDELAVKKPEIYFLADRWTPHRLLPRDRTIVFEFENPVSDQEAKQLNSDVTDSIKFPCWYVYRPEKDRKSVMIVIITDQNEGKYSTGNIYEGIKKKFGERCARIVDFVTLMQERNQVWNDDFLFKYKLNEAKSVEKTDLNETEAAGETDDSADEGFEVVGPQRRKAKQKYSEQCIYRFACRWGNNCQYGHTSDEKEHFKIHPQNLGKLFKAKFCGYAENKRCKYQNEPKKCCYAHSINEARCYNCETGGLVGDHWMDQCPNKKS